MNKPELYIKENGIALSDAVYTLKTNLEILKNSNNCTVLDVGCGPGNVTCEKILPLLPSSTKSLIGVDISYHHVEYARKHYQNDSRISYEVLDILCDEVPSKYVGAYDLVLSMHCFDFVGDHRKALTNMYKMMKPNSKMLINFESKSTFYKAHYSVYNNPKWKKYMEDFSKWVPVSQTEQYYKATLKEIGFEQIECEQLDKGVVVSEQNAFDIFNALNVFAVPKSEEKNFIEDHIDYYEKEGHVTINDKGDRQLYYGYTLLTITACKL